MAKFKTENGVEFPAAAFAYVPDGSVPSSWKLRLWEDLDKKTTAVQVGRAVAAIGKGFRGEKVQIPPKDRPAVLMRIKAAWNKVHESGDELPDVLKKKTFATEADVHEYFGAGADPAIPIMETGEADFHIHRFSPVATHTDVPSGLFKGHRHEITTNEDGLVTGFGDSAGHSHPMPEYAEGFLSEVQAFRSLADVSELHSVKGVEIFKAGTWNGDEYETKDLDDIVAAFDKVGFQVPIKLGHSKEVGEPAYGWVERVYRKGKKLVADFKDLPKKLYDAIKDRRFDAVSSEIFWNLERDGKKHRRVLKAVALLGGETPAVSGLAPLRTVVNADLPPLDGFGRVGVYSFELKEEGEDMDKFEELQAQAKQLEQDLETATSALAEAEKKAAEAVGEAKATADAELAETQDKVKKLEADLVSAQEEVSKLAGDQSKEVAALTEQVSTLSGQLAEMSEDRRQRTIAEKTDKFPIPALKRFMAPLYDIATSTSREVEFTAKDGEDPAKQSMEGILDAMTGFFTENAEKIFQTKKPLPGGAREGGSDDLPGFDGDPSVEVDKRARAYMDEHDKVSYVDAVQHVLKGDAQLNDAYTSFSSHGSAH